MGEITQRPYDDGGHENDASHLLQVLLAFLPCMAQDCLDSRETVGWELHHEGSVLTFYYILGEDTADDDGQQDSDGIERNHDEALVLHCKEGSHNHDVDRQTCRTTHQRQHHHGNES